VEEKGTYVAYYVWYIDEEDIMWNGPSACLKMLPMGIDMMKR